MERTPSSSRPLHHSVMAIIFPPLAHWHHRRYHGRPHHFVIDSGLNLVMLGLGLWVGIIFWFAAQTSGIGIAMTIPKIVNNVPVNLVFNVHNRSSKTLEAATLRLGLPNNWVNQTSLSDSFLGDIQPNATKSVTVTILPRGTANHHYHLRLIAQGQRGALQATQSATISLQLETMPLTVSATGTTGTIGQPMTLQFVITNISDEIEDAVVVRPITSATLSFRSAIPALSNTAWTFEHLAPRASHVVRLTVMPGSVGTLKLPVEIGVRRSGAFILDRTDNVKLTISTSPTPEDLLTASPQRVANISTEAMYYSSVGFQFGYGPLPPQVGQETTFRIFWYVRPSLANASGGSVTAVLPTSVIWKGNGSVTAGSAITYDPNQRRVRWAVGAWNGGQEVVTGSFDVGLTPTRGQIGRYPTLVFPTSLSYVTSDGRLQVVQSASASTRTADPRHPQAGQVVQ